MKEKITEAWKRETKTIKNNPMIVEQFANRLETELREQISLDLGGNQRIEKTLKQFQKKQKNGAVIFRQTDKSKVFHLDRPETYKEKSAAYMKKTDAYVEIEQSPLNDMIEKTVELLRNLVERKLLPGKYFEKLKPNKEEAELPHLYYNPKDHKIGEPLRPIVSGMKSPTQRISAFLDQIIRPIFDKFTPYSLTNSIEFLKQLEQHKTSEETLLYTFDITDLYTMIPQQESIIAICEMLGQNKINKINNEIPINTVRILFKHVLENAYFALQLPGEKVKYYKQVRGGPMGSECTQVLADVYMRKWEKEVKEKQDKEGEIYLRFRDDIFLTTRKNKEEIEKYLTELGKKDKNIGLTFETGEHVDYLDVRVKVEIPNFRTKVYRKLAAQPYILPFNSAHPPHIMKNIPYAALLRALRICSHSEDLAAEIEKIRITLLLNKYPPNFIDRHFKRFYEEITGENSERILLSDKHSEYRNKVMNIQWNKKDKRKIDFNKDVIVHFSYTPSLARFGARFHQIWNEIFEETPLNDIPVIFAHRLTDNLKSILVHKKPSKAAISNALENIEQ
jgi:Reverse transcriptase (RNA-dependent DNA polymerase)